MGEFLFRRAKRQAPTGMQRYLATGEQRVRIIVEMTAMRSDGSEFLELATLRSAMPNSDVYRYLRDISSRNKRRRAARSTAHSSSACSNALRKCRSRVLRSAMESLQTDRRGKAPGVVTLFKQPRRVSRVAAETVPADSGATLDCTVPTALRRDQGRDSSFSRIERRTCPRMSNGNRDQTGQGSGRSRQRSSRLRRTAGI